MPDFFLSFFLVMAQFLSVVQPATINHIHY